jgi:hypothetical protein
MEGSGFVGNEVWLTDATTLHERVVRRKPVPTK